MDIFSLLSLFRYTVMGNQIIRIKSRMFLGKQRIRIMRVECVQ